MKIQKSREAGQPFSGGSSTQQVSGCSHHKLCSFYCRFITWASPVDMLDHCMLKSTLYLPRAPLEPFRSSLRRHVTCHMCAWLADICCTVSRYAKGFCTAVPAIESYNLPDNSFGDTSDIDGPDGIDCYQQWLACHLDHKATCPVALLHLNAQSYCRLITVPAILSWSQQIGVHQSGVAGPRP